MGSQLAIILVGFGVISDCGSVLAFAAWLQAKAMTEKEAGNAAYRAGRNEEAVKHFTECIRLDSRYMFLSHIKIIENSDVHHRLWATPCVPRCGFVSIL